MIDTTCKYLGICGLIAPYLRYYTGIEAERAAQFSFILYLSLTRFKAGMSLKKVFPLYNPLLVITAEVQAVA